MCMTLPLPKLRLLLLSPCVRAKAGAGEMKGGRLYPRGCSALKSPAATSLESDGV